MDMEELRNWLAFHEHIEPIGAVRDDVRLSLMTAHLLNVHVDKKHKMIDPADIMPTFESAENEVEEKLTSEQTFKRFEVMTLALGGKIIK